MSASLARTFAYRCDGCGGLYAVYFSNRRLVELIEDPDAPPSYLEEMSERDRRDDAEGRVDLARHRAEAKAMTFVGGRVTELFTCACGREHEVGEFLRDVAAEMADRVRRERGL